MKYCRVSFLIFSTVFLFASLTSCGSEDTPAPTITGVNGCDVATATDMTGQVNVIITNTAIWSNPHSACIIVDAGTVVTWQGDFTAHPLMGGVTPTVDMASVITVAGPGSGSTPVDVTFSAAGDFPYFCGIHTTTMIGVVYVR